MAESTGWKKILEVDFEEGGQEPITPSRHPEVSPSEPKDLGGAAFAANRVFCGGDELLARVDCDKFDEDRFREFMTLFKEKTGVTISFGVGRDTAEIFINLARAKAAGPGSLFCVRQG